MDLYEPNELKWVYDRWEGEDDNVNMIKSQTFYNFMHTYFSNFYNNTDSYIKDVIFIETYPEMFHSQEITSKEIEEKCHKLSKNDYKRVSVWFEYDL